MATFFPIHILILLFLGSLITGTHSFRIGINYGRVADNLPTPSRVASFILSLNITRVRVYDADPEVLSAFANTNVELTIGLEDKYIENFTDPAQAQNWVQQKVAPYTNQTNIKMITIGNEVLTGNDTKMMISLLPAMQNVQNALADLGLSQKIHVNTPHSYGIMGVSFPPSLGTFKPELVDYLMGILVFLSQTDSPFLINVNPYFAYRDDPEHVSLAYVLFEPNPGQTDPITNLHYDNMLYAQMDAVYSALNALYPQMDSALNASDSYSPSLRVDEIGWSCWRIPRKWRPPPSGIEQASLFNLNGTDQVENARVFNGNLLKRVEEKQGTPLRPSDPIDAYIFALFDEDLKPGPESERHFGLFYPNMTPAYDIGLQGHGGRGRAVQRVDYTVSGINNNSIVGGLFGFYMAFICILLLLI
ncbi:Glucan endo-1-3-beta-glucosidase 14 [Striga hermonthica]|uniref:Glucan endo-1-3-beta-glucosidase 14 n=1 Tax=Striga hermonthica TaxID=68872 RepID=A0A9N7NA15_STRHE|nr:Glucan endo-1-3-beta-glucosidase 14 [Striga hermonthica]